MVCVKGKTAEDRAVANPYLGVLPKGAQLPSHKVMERFRA
jgi:hypothetical protein